MPKPACTLPMRLIPPPPQQAYWNLHLPPDADDATVRAAVERTGVDPDQSYGQQILRTHSVRRYEHKTGLPF